MGTSEGDARNRACKANDKRKRGARFNAPRRGHEGARGKGHRGNGPPEQARSVRREHYSVPRRGGERGTQGKRMLGIGPLEQTKIVREVHASVPRRNGTRRHKGKGSWESKHRSKPKA